MFRANSAVDVNIDAAQNSVSVPESGNSLNVPSTEASAPEFVEREISLTSSVQTEEYVLAPEEPVALPEAVARSVAIRKNMLNEEQACWAAKDSDKASVRNGVCIDDPNESFETNSEASSLGKAPAGAEQAQGQWVLEEILEKKRRKRKIVLITILIILFFCAAVGLALGLLFGLSDDSSDSGSSGSGGGPEDEPGVPSGDIGDGRLYEECHRNGIPDGNGGCICYTNDYSSASHCKDYVGRWSFGVQKADWKGCTARTDISEDTVKGLTNWICTEFLTGSAGTVSDKCVVLMQKHGSYQRLNAWAKAHRAIGFWREHIVSQEQREPWCDELKGRLSEDRFVVDNDSDFVMIDSEFTGPAVWPGTFTVDAGLDLCPAGKECCLPAVVANPQDTWDYRWTEMSRIIPALCESGADCSSVIPGGEHVDDWDMYRQLGFVATDFLNKYGECKWSESKLTRCINNMEGTTCKINFVPGVYTDWTGFY